MGNDPRSFGAQLRQTVEATATEAAKRAVGEHIDGMAASIAKAGDTAARQAAQQAAQQAVEKLGADLMVEARVSAKAIEALAERVAKIDAILAGADFKALEAACRDVHEQQERLISTRKALTEEQAQSRRAEGELRAIAKQLTGTVDAYLDLGSHLAIEVEEMRKATDLRATRAAALAVEGLRQSVVDGLAHESKRATEQVTDQVRADLSKACADAEGRLAAWSDSAQEAVADFIKSADILTTELVQKADAALTGEKPEDAPLVPRAYRGAYRELTKHQRGDMVTYLGSTFIATTATDAKPSVDPSSPWQLFAAGGFGDRTPSKKPRA